jgi:hypothetical protein
MGDKYLPKKVNASCCCKREELEGEMALCIDNRRTTLALSRVMTRKWVRSTPHPTKAPLSNENTESVSQCITLVPGREEKPGSLPR